MRPRSRSIPLIACIRGMRGVMAALGVMISMSGAAGADEVVKIGFAAPLTGALAQFGKETETGAQLAVDELNAHPLIVNGKAVQLVLDAQDDAGDPRAATQVAQRLIDNGVVAIVGHMTSGTSVPASRLYHNAGVAQLSPGATSPVYTHQGFATAFRLVATDAAQGAALADYAAHSLLVRNIVLIDDQSEYGESLASSFERAARKNGIEIARREAISPYGIDFHALLTILKALNPDAILFSGFVNAGVPFIRQARQLNLRSLILGGDGLCSEALGRLTGKSADGVVCSIPGSDFRNSQRGAAFALRYRQRFGAEPDGFAPYSYDAVYVIADAMTRAKSTAAGDILRTVPTTNLDGVTGSIAFDQHGDLRKSITSIFRYRNGDRDVVFVEKEAN
jgi:branched-chain amino acid transport system substrate-binding protein